MSAGGIICHPTTPGWSEGLKRVTEEEEIFLFDEHDQELGTNNNTSSHLNHLEGLVQETKGISIHNNNETDNNNSFVNVHRRLFLHSSYGQHSPANSYSSVASSTESEISMTIEGLRDHLQSCFTCGVLWRENQASLDCHECDGYALSRPCLDCNGNCTAVWKRDLTTSHQTHKAKWVGSCQLLSSNCSVGTDSSDSATTTATSTSSTDW